MAMDTRKPNYFLAVRMNDDIKRSLEDACSRLIQFNPRYKQICTPKDEFHLTLCLLSIADGDQLNTSRKALLDAVNELKSQSISCRFDVAGLSTFNGKVVFANVDYGREFLILRSIILSFFDAAGVNVVDTEFKPHVTVAKVTKSFTCREGASVVDSRSYASDRRTIFGKQAVDNISLCKMGSERQTDAFYVTEATVYV